MFVARWQETLSDLQMLNHPFYQAWMRGDLTVEELRNYTVQYKPFVDAFPRFVSRIHSHCEDALARKALLINLLEEEGHPAFPDHPTLWRNFARGLGVTDAEFDRGPVGEAARHLVETFWHFCHSSYAEGLGALTAYERQIPEVARAKIDGLRERYGIAEPATIEFFTVHETADALHAKSCEDLLERLDAGEQDKALRAARETAQALWDFLTSCRLHADGDACVPA